MAQERVAEIAEHVPKDVRLEPSPALGVALEKLIGYDAIVLPFLLKPCLPISERILKRSEEEFRKMKSRGILGKIVHVRTDKETIISLREEMRVMLDSINVRII